MDILLASFAFFLGTFLQAYWSIRAEPKRNWYICLGILGIYLIIVFIAYLQGKLIDSPAFFGGSLIFVSAVYTFYRKSLLPAVNETIIFFNTAAFWYFTIFLLSGKTQEAAILLAALPTLASIFSIIYKKNLREVLRIALYIWNLIILVLVLFYQFLGAVMDFSEPTSTLGTFFQFFFFGVLCFFVIIHAFPIFSFFPNKRTGWTNAREHIILFSQKYSDAQATPRMLLFFLGLLIIFAVNRAFFIVSDILLVSLIIIASTMLFQKTQPF